MVPVCPCSSAELLVSGGIPQPHSLAAAARREGTAVGGERNAGEPLRPRQTSAHFARGCVPQSNRAIVTGRGEPLAVGRKRHIDDRATVAAQDGAREPDFRVPERDGLTFIIVGSKCLTVERVGQRGYPSPAFPAVLLVSRPVAGSQRRTVPSRLAVARVRPSGAKRTARTV